MADNMIRKGICTNFQNCEIADSHKTVEVGLTEDFVCPKCGNDLKEVKDASGTPVWIYFLIGIAVVGVAVVVFLLFFPKEKTTVPPFGGGENTTVVEDSIRPTNRPTGQPADTPPESEPAVAGEARPAPPTANPAPAPESTVAIRGGTYKGELKGGKPHGQGTLTYNSRTRISSRDMKERYAEAGQYIIGQFYEGELEHGTLYDTNNEPIEVLRIGR